MKTLLLIPIINGQDKFLDTLSDVQMNVSEADVLFIDYGSTDRTKYQLKNNGVNHLIMPVESTYYQALSLGMIFAKKNHYDMVIEWDDKGKFKSEDIKYFIATMKRSKVDLVLGSRFVHKKPPYKARWFGTRSLRRVIKLVTGKKLSDPTFRFRAYGKKAIDFLAQHEQNGPAPDSIAKMLKMEYSYKEVQTSLNKGVKRQLKLTTRQASGEMFRWTFWIVFVLPFVRHKKEKR